MRQQGAKTSIQKIIEVASLEASISKKVENQIKSIFEENEHLKDEIQELRSTKPEEGKYGNVRIQYQILFFLGVLNSFPESGVKEKGIFFSSLLNRHPQRARKPFSSINDLIFSNNKATAKLIKRDLLKVQELFQLIGAKKKVREVQQAINKIDEKHFPKNL